MAERRMFAKKIIESDSFLDMPVSARCLYFTLGMLADDEGVINNCKSIMRISGTNEDDLKELINKKFVLSLTKGNETLIIIKHWRINNYIQNDRFNPSTYRAFLESKITLDDNKAYKLLDNNSKETNVSSNVYTQDSIVKVSEDKDTKKEDKEKRFTKPTLEEVKAYCEERNNNVSAEKFINFYESKGWKVGKTPMKDWKACVRTWEQKENNNKSTTNNYQAKNTLKPSNDYGDTI